MPLPQEIHIVLHTHTDLGFTIDQPMFWDLHGRFIDEALDRIDSQRESGLPEDEAFKWTCEAWLPVRHWWERATMDERRRFRRAEDEGRMEVTGMPLHLAPLYDLALMSELFESLDRFRSATGLRVDSAMNCDVNGQHWFLSDLMLDHKIRGYSVAINTHFGHCPFFRPNLFRWQTPSGRSLPSHNGFVYGFANRFAGLTRAGIDAFAADFLSKLEQRLEEAGWQLPVLLLQGVHSFGDNGSIPVGMEEAVRVWNAWGKGPRLRISTMRQWWDAALPFVDQLPDASGDWTDSWNFGAGSAAREAAVAKRAQARLQAGETLAALLGADKDARLERTLRDYGVEAWETLGLWCEHTWGADCGVGEPGTEDTEALWNHKANYAYRSRSLAHLVRRDALAALARSIAPQPGFDDDPASLVVFNPLPWKRIMSGMLPATVSPTPRGGRGDPTAGRLYAERRPDWHAAQSASLTGAWLDQLPQYVLRPVEVEGFGYVALPSSAMAKVADETQTLDGLVFENEFLFLEIDSTNGGLRTLRLKGQDRNLVNRSSPWGFPGWIRESIDQEKADPERRTFFEMDWMSPDLVYRDGWHPDWPARRQRSGPCQETKSFRLPDGYYVSQRIHLPESMGDLVLKLCLPDRRPWVEFRMEWWQGLETRPEGFYISLPLNLVQPQVRVDLGGLAVDPAREQLPGVNRDFVNLGRWVDFNDELGGVTIATPENPLAQLGSFRFGRNHESFSLAEPLFLGWASNNYWETNFRAHQPGRVGCRYRIYPYAGSFDAAASHRRGAEATFDQVQAHPLGERCQEVASLPRVGAFLRICDAETGEATAVQVVRCRAEGDCLAMAFYNDGSESRKVLLEGGVRAIAEVTANEGESVKMEGGRATLLCEPRRLRKIKVRLRV